MIRTGRLPAAINERIARLSLRRRLIIVQLALLLTSCAIIAAASTLALRHFLLTRLDQQLTAAGNRYAISLEHPSDGDTDNPFRAVTGQAAGTLGARILHGTVTSIGLVPAGDEPDAVSPTARARIASLSASTQPRTIDLPGLGDYRVLVQAGRDGDLLVTGLPQHGLDETIARLATIEAIVFAAALLLTGLIGALAIRLSLRPLTRVAHTAREVATIPLAVGAVTLPTHQATSAPGTEVGQVAEAFAHMLEHVQIALAQRHASEQRLRQFIADASHELRTPVAVIRSYAEHAQYVGKQSPGETTTALARITAESARMGRLVDDLLLLSRLDSGRPLAHDNVDLTRLVLDSVSDARIAGPDHRWRLELPDEPAMVIGDEHRLHQAIANLLANARTHTPAGTTVTTQLRRLAAGDVEVVVNDDGPGISPQLVPHVFERFVRADAARTHAAGSSGLGLPITEAVIHAHHGSITVASEPGRTRFTIHLPGFTGEPEEASMP